jgi:hypothetical protein
MSRRRISPGWAVVASGPPITSVTSPADALHLSPTPLWTTSEAVDNPRYGASPHRELSAASRNVVRGGRRPRGCQGPQRAGAQSPTYLDFCQPSLPPAPPWRRFGGGLRPPVSSVPAGTDSKRCPQNALWTTAQPVDNSRSSSIREARLSVPRRSLVRGGRRPAPSRPLAPRLGSAASRWRLPTTRPAGTGVGAHPELGSRRQRDPCHCCRPLALTTRASVRFRSRSSVEASARYATHCRCCPVAGSPRGPRTADPPSPGSPWLGSAAAGRRRPTTAPAVPVWVPPSGQHRQWRSPERVVGSKWAGPRWPPEPRRPTLVRNARRPRPS